jgi:hypothetical protein
VDDSLRVVCTVIDGADDEILEAFDEIDCGVDGFKVLMTVK